MNQPATQAPQNRRHPYGLTLLSVALQANYAAYRADYREMFLAALKAGPILTEKLSLGGANASVQRNRKRRGRA